MNKYLKVLFVLSTIFIVSCKTKEKASQLNYMQNAEQIATDASIKNAVKSIQPGDQLMIFVTAKDMTVVKPFNQNYSSAETSTLTMPNGNTPNQGQVNMGGPTYIVDANGEIDFPILGKLNTTGKTLTDFQDELRTKVSKYVINPTVNLKISNYKITVLGEVNKPGQYIIPDGQSTILNALGLAGDLTMYAKRNDILLVRNENGQIIKERINLLDDNFMYSPFYQLKQNDVIYVSANETKEKTARLDPNTSTYIAIAGTIIGLAGIFITIFKK